MCYIINHSITFRYMNNIPNFMKTCFPRGKYPRKYYEVLFYSFNPLQPDVAYLYPLKTSENVKVFDVFRGYR